MKRHLFFYSSLLFIFAIFSYSLTAPNLILSNWQPYWRAQTWFWKTFYNQRQLLGWTFLGLGLLIWSSYFLLLPKIKEYLQKNSSQKVVPLIWLTLIISPLLLANNALSHDVFNYIFNARMVIKYQANPHQQVALDFANDDWTRFMHNTHTPAPYFYGWTLLSLLPYLGGIIIGAGKFLITWFLFRFFSFLSWLGLVLVMRWFLKIIKKRESWWHYALWLNPLLIIEVVANVHNDLWMMLPATFSILLLITNQTKINKNLRFVWLKRIISLSLLVASITVKIASIALLPLWLSLAFDWSLILPKIKVVKKINCWLNNNWAFLASLLLFLPLLTARSKYFLPWYLSWSLIWLPLINKRWNKWRWSLIVLSVSSFFRYLPYLLSGNYETQVLRQQILITWIPFLAYWLLVILSKINTRLKVKINNKHEKN